MINHNRKIRTVRDIQTFSGKVEQVVVPHKAYLRVSCLEMEKARRNKERENAVFLINKIDARFKEIEAEKTMLFQALNQTSPQIGLPPTNNFQKIINEPQPGFKIRY